MSVSHKKINGLIESVVAEIATENSNIDEEVLVRLCQEIYLLESSTTLMANSVKITQIQTEIDHLSDQVFRSEA